MTPLAVPAQVGMGADLMRVGRAWPSRLDDGARVSLEGTDPSGRLRAAELRLVPAAGPGWAVERLSLAPYGSDPRLPGLAAAAEGGEVVVHRFGRRAVVRRGDSFVKVVRPGRADQVAATAEAGRLLAERAGFTAPAVRSAGEGTVDFSVLPGRSLHELGASAPLDRWFRLWEGWARRWPALAGAASAAPCLPSYSAQDEQATLRGWVDRTRALGLLPADPALSERLERVLARLADAPAGPPVVAHRDLHDKQLLAEGEELGVLDFDTMALAEPALDLANLAVHAALRVEQGLWSTQHGAAVVESVRGVAQVLEVDPERLETWAEATRLRLACVYAFRPRYRRLALAWALRPDEKSLTPVSSTVQIRQGGSRA